jgi:hypothetical protein
MGRFSYVRQILPPTLLAASAALLTGCLQPPAPFPDLDATLGAGWTAVPLPNSSLAPGAIVQVTAPNGGAVTNTSQLQVRWLGALQDCGVPATALVVNQAAVPGISSGSTFSLSASIAADLAGVSLGSLGGDASSSTNLTITTATDSALNYIDFTRWANDPANRMALAAACGPALNQPNTYIIQEAFIISSGSYNFKNTRGATISVTPPPQVPVKLSASGSDSGNAAITISSPIVFALKVLQPVPGGSFQVATITPVAGASASHHVLGAHHARTAAAPPPPPPPPASAAPLPDAPLTLGDKAIVAAIPKP